MAVSESCIKIDPHGLELADHGTSAFPVACYHDEFHIMNVPWHWHPEWEAVRITAGSCTVAAGQHRVKLHAGEGFFINSGILHGCWDEDASGCLFHSLVFHPRLVGGSLDSVFHQQYVLGLLENPSMGFVPLRPTVPWQAQALRHIEDTWQQCFQEPEGFEFRTRSELSQFVFQLYRNMPAPPALAGAKALRDADRIKQMLSFIHDHYSEELAVSSIAASASISESECLRCFHSAIGTSPIRYLKQYRIRQAARLLVSTPQKVSDIAQRCGFQDVSYFTKTFREQMHCTPSEYRNAERRSE